MEEDEGSPAMERDLPSTSRKVGKRKSRQSSVGGADDSDIDDKFDRLLAVSAEVKRAEAAATEKIQLWRSASGFDAMSAALKEWQFWIQEKERLLTAQLRPLAQEIVAFYKKQLDEDAERVIEDDEGEDDEGEVALGRERRASSSGSTGNKSEVDDLAMSLSEVLSLVERVRANSMGDRHGSPSKRRRNMPIEEQESECMSAEDRTPPPVADNH
ncbi:uncharacterized protein ACA1_071670 [Acanthamoeba castellanii str. Neff]|jgi:hypothetical protein|uniref:Uncharacterized protein n=1 Tax=Acanthamoeba castellanii (strain ATCC 30010 / Neff) TaxID=1257118 RepID=L8HEE0_ACACF|nr:uncharacterized protein ACA1_071670 [Acanthamoeba castellanii str. Neff]ELR23545.1 hypothetical protein ACA1_071670 [Acanthamoeba castellanii str. Neff]